MNEPGLEGYECWEIPRAGCWRLYRRRCRRPCHLGLWRMEWEPAAQGPQEKPPENGTSEALGNDV